MSLSIADDNDNDSTYKEIDEIHLEPKTQPKSVEHEYEQHEEDALVSGDDCPGCEDASSTTAAVNDDSLPESNFPPTATNSREGSINNDTATLLLENIGTSASERSASTNSGASGSHHQQTNGADGQQQTIMLASNDLISGKTATTKNHHKSNQSYNHAHLMSVLDPNNEKRKTSTSSSASSTARSLRSNKHKNNSTHNHLVECAIDRGATKSQQGLTMTPTSTNPTVSAESITTQTTTASAGANMKPYSDKIAEGKAALENKDYQDAILIFTSCIEMNSNDYILYGYRSKAYFKEGHYPQSLLDAIKARELNPKWTEAYYRQAISLFHLNRHADSLAAFAYGLSWDPGNERILDGLVRTAKHSEFGEKFEPEYRQLVIRNLHKEPFVIVSVIGHELLNRHYHHQAIIIMDAATKIGHSSPKMIGAVSSALSSAHWSLKNYDRSVEYMKKDLKMQMIMNDINGQCRVFGNLGFAYYILRRFKESLQAHRKQLELAMAIKNVQQAVIALNALGHIHVALNDLSSALLSHTRCLQLLKQIGDNDGALSRELACVGHIYTLMEEYDKAREHHSEHIKLTNGSLISRHEECQTNLVMANSNMAFLAIKKKNYDEARTYHEQVIKLAQRLGGRTGKIYEMRACGGLGHTYRLSNRFQEARKWFERQLELANETEDRIGKGQALCNLGMIDQQNNNHESASKLFSENKSIVEKDPYLSAYANSYMGSVYYSTKQYEESIHFYKESLLSFDKLDGCSSEAATINVNISLAYERLGEFNTALSHCQRSKQY